MHTLISLSIRLLTSFTVSLFLIYTPAAVASMSHLYGKSGTPIPTSRELDIKNLNEEELIEFLETKNGKTFCEKYRNSLGRNLVFLAAREGKFKLLRAMKEKKIDVEHILQASNIISIIEGIDIDKFLEIAPGFIEDSVVRNMLLKADLSLLNTLPLDIDFWDRVEKSKYLSLLSGNEALKSKLPEDFIFVGLSTILDHAPSPLHTSFLQKDFAQRVEADFLWHCFLERHDKLSQKSSPNLPHAIRILGIAQLFKKKNEDCDHPKELKEIAILQSNVLAMGGTFGMNFERTATSEEAEIMIASLESIGYDLRNVQKILNALFVKYFQDLSEAQKYQLENHQINCAVIALHSALFEQHGDDVFEAIDLVLRKKLSRSFTNSKERHGKLMELAGRSSVSAAKQDLDFNMEQEDLGFNMEQEDLDVDMRSRSHSSVSAENQGLGFDTVFPNGEIEEAVDMTNPNTSTANPMSFKKKETVDKDNLQK